MTILQPTTDPQSFKIIPRYLDLNSELTIYDELRSRNVTFNLINKQIVDDSMVFTISSNFTTGKNLEITLKDSLNRLSFNGKAQVIWKNKFH